MKVHRPSPLSRALTLLPPTALLVAQHANAALTGYIKIGDIKGESTDAKHAEWIDVLSFEYKVDRIDESSPSSSGTTPEADFGPIKIVKKIDASSTALFLKVADGSSIPTVTLELVDEATSVVFYRVTLSNVTVTSISGRGDSTTEDRIESITLNYEEVDWTYITVDPKTGITKGSTTAKWDIVNSKEP